MKVSRMLRPLFLPAFVLVVAVLSACSKNEQAPTPVRSVKLMQVGGGALSVRHEFAAEIRARTESRLGFQVPGRLLQRLVDPGQKVKAGQLLATLDPQDYQANAQAAVAQLQAAQSQRDLAVADVRRFQSLREQGFISAAELERHQVALKAAEAGLKQAQASASVLGNQAAYTRLVADADGVIAGVDAEPGQVLAAGSPVVRLARSGPRDAVFAVPEGQLAALKTGQKVQVRLWLSNDKPDVMGAQVREIGASADPLTRTYVVKAGLAQADAPLGATATVEWQPAEPVAAGSGTIRLPMTAVWQQGQNTAVWVFDAKHSTVGARTVTLSGVDGNMASISAGLQPGEEVVVVGTHVLTEGQVVTRFVSTEAKPSLQPKVGEQP